MRLGIYGGTFDPVHEAHIAIAERVQERFALDRVLLIPNNQPPHRRATGATYEQRLAMLRLATADHPRLLVSDVEAAAQPSYTVDTLGKIREEYGESADLHFVIGADAFREIHTWYRWRDVVALTKFIVVSRPGYEFVTPDGARVHVVEDFSYAVSSSRIRAEMYAGLRPKGLHPAVEAFIMEHRIYRAADQTTRS